MTGDEAAWKEVWERKADGREVFAQAELCVDKVFSHWNGHGEPDTAYARRPGDVVLITTVSRFGHACIRGIDVQDETHGYDATAQPHELRNLRFLSDGGVPWRKQMLADMGCWDEK